MLGGRLTYPDFTIVERRFTIGSRFARIVSPSGSRVSRMPAYEEPMKKDQEIVRIELTPEQKQLVKQEIGKEGDAVELTVKELEERIAPRRYIAY